MVVRPPLLSAATPQLHSFYTLWWIQLVFSYGASIQYIHGAYLLETLVESAVVVLVIGVDVELVLLGRRKQCAHCARVTEGNSLPFCHRGKRKQDQLHSTSLPALQFVVVHFISYPL